MNEKLSYSSRGGLVLYSDGGSKSHCDAGAGCIIQNNLEGWTVKFAVYLGSGTNNEAEIAAALIGFSFINTLERESDDLLARVRWLCDSQYVLKSATAYIWNWQKNGWRTAGKDPVKNQGLWRAFLILSSGILIESEHVQGHTGNIGNEACDLACNWVREEGVKALNRGEEGALVKLSDEVEGSKWVLLDGRDFLKNLQVEKPSPEAIWSMKHKINKSYKAKPRANITVSVLRPVLVQLERALEVAVRVSTSDSSRSSAAKNLASDLASLLEKYREK